MAIASLGGATVNNDGSRSYPGSGGYVGGLSFNGGNYSVFTGAGSNYNKFTPTSNLIEAPITDDDPPTGGGGGGGGGTYPTPAPSPTGTTNTPVVYNPPFTPYRGLSAISSGGSQLISTLNSIFSRYTSGDLTLADAYSNAQRITGYLSDSNVFYQAQRGDDANALMRFKRQAYDILRAITGWEPTITEPTTPTNPTTPNPTDIPIEVPQSILNILASLVPSEKTKIDQPANLYSFAPTGGSSTNSSGSSNIMRNVLLLVAVAAVAYFLYKKYA